MPTLLGGCRIDEAPHLYYPINGGVCYTLACPHWLVPEIVTRWERIMLCKLLE